MSKKYNQNDALIPAEDEQFIAELTAYLSVRSGMSAVNT